MTGRAHEPRQTAPSPFRASGRPLRPPASNPRAQFQRRPRKVNASVNRSGQLVGVDVRPAQKHMQRSDQLGILVGPLDQSRSCSLFRRHPRLAKSVLTRANPRKASTSSAFRSAETACPRRFRLQAHVLRQNVAQTLVSAAPRLISALFQAADKVLNCRRNSRLISAGSSPAETRMASVSISER
jgi:hypothetical protein